MRKCFDKPLSVHRFDNPKSFTNAVLHNTEITTLIRDTEPYEHGLFSIEDTSKQSSGTNRPTAHSGRPSRSSAIARVLGSDLLSRIQHSNRTNGETKRVDIEVLLQGAEKLCLAYEVDGAQDRISSLRHNHERICGSIQQYEQIVSTQQTRLRNLSDGRSLEQARMSDVSTAPTRISRDISEEDMSREEEVIKELEIRKKALERRVADMQRDLGGLRS